MSHASSCAKCSGYSWALLFLVLILSDRGEAAAVHAPIDLKRSNWTMTLGEDGSVRSFTDGRVELAPATFSGPQLQFAEKQYVCDHPVSADADSDRAVFHSRIQDATLRLKIEYEVRLQELSGERLVVVQQVRLFPEMAIHHRFDLMVGRPAQLGDSDRYVFIPAKEGYGVIQSVTTTEQHWYFYLTGSVPDASVPLLAIPMIDEFSKSHALRLTYGADPWFTTRFTSQSSPPSGAFACTYEAGSVPFTAQEERTLYTILHKGDASTAMENFYETALADVPPGPDWLHEIAMVDYDYLSDGGLGWQRDIDWLTDHLSREDRGRVCLALHGWYDLLGHYAFNQGEGKMEDRWTAFPNAPAVLDKFPNSRSVEMTCDEVRRRLEYARTRGFRVVLYFADGMAVCEGAPEYDREILLYSGGWQGPDTIGSTHMQNPLHPRVRRWFLDYMDALLREFGDHTDGFVWDETFHVDPSHFGGKTAPGYAARAMMELCAELTRKVHRRQENLAFLASDCIGVFDWNQKAPYALVCDGTYQDSHCRPEAWPYGLFPNLRNVLWSCNWNPVTHFDWTRLGVERYQAPVAISNGWGDDLGVSEMDDETAQQFMQLFQQRKAIQTHLRWLDPGTW